MVWIVGMCEVAVIGASSCNNKTRESVKFSSRPHSILVELSECGGCRVSSLTTVNNYCVDCASLAHFHTESLGEISIRWAFLST